VVPRADGGQTSWTNIVAACSPCNARKDRLRIKPLRAPVEPSQHDLLAAQRLFPPNFMHETWTDFLYWDVELEH
jgi:5-methylcytosine-specific restriction endonuclease McrA